MVRRGAYHGMEVILPRGEHPAFQGASLDRIGLVATNGINLQNCDAMNSALGGKYKSDELHFYN